MTTSGEGIVVYRIHFDCADLARTTIAQRPDPLWEVLLGLHVLQGDEEPEVYGPWRERVRGRLTVPERELIALAPPVGYSPDFLTPRAAGEGLEAGLTAVAATPASQLISELRRLSDSVRLPNWTRRLASGDTGVMTRLVHGLRSFHRTKIAPQLPMISTAIEPAVAQHNSIVANDGFESLIPQLHGSLGWAAPVLSVDMPHVNRDLYLNGRGLRLVPSFFCWKYPMMLLDPTLPPVLVYPVKHDPAPVVVRRPDRDRAVAVLLGRTRAQVLTCISDGACSTSELAARTGISPASASEHARVLHDTGLVTTHRVGSSVRHTLNRVGAEVLAGART
ncbi:ArsR/SmtB family transcription factor [Kribbella solani]|uniref:ArsR/SmtB family transcription factor n=1 Tax=Kribbella solani TaxID=236067 RepID=UPI0029A03454|nr:winged helix-turn-helix domain-containing protein [Kribbella solani]MDX2972719.1 winged helix-turn-helix domain-containing protein [Kribbella solani]